MISFINVLFTFVFTSSRKCSSCVCLVVVIIMMEAPLKADRNLIDSVKGKGKVIKRERKNEKRFNGSQIYI